MFSGIIRGAALTGATDAIIIIHVVLEASPYLGNQLYRYGNAQKLQYGQEIISFSTLNCGLFRAQFSTFFNCFFFFSFFLFCKVILVILFVKFF